MSRHIWMSVSCLTIATPSVANVTWLILTCEICDYVVYVIMAYTCDVREYVSHLHVWYTRLCTIHHTYMLGCNNGGGGGNFSKVKQLAAKWIGKRKQYKLVFCLYRRGKKKSAFLLYLKTVFFEAHLWSSLKTWQFCSLKSYKIFIEPSHTIVTP